MSFTKKITVNYFLIYANEENYFEGLYNALNAMLESSNPVDYFEYGDLNFMWQILDAVDFKDEPQKIYFAALVGERKLLPYLFSKDGIKEIDKTQTMVGDLSYALISPGHKFLICFSTVGTAGSAYKKVLGQYSASGVVKLAPLADNSAEERVLSWDAYKKLGLRMAMQSYDEIEEFYQTNLGKLTGILKHLAGLKMDVSVSGDSTTFLSNIAVREIIDELLPNETATVINVCGSDFDGGDFETVDIKNARIKYVENVEIDNGYISKTLAKDILLRALSENFDMLLKSGK
jgi:hypothetical protein